VDANIIFGAVIDDALGDEVRVTVIAAGFDDQQRSRAGSVAAASRPNGASGGGAPASTAMDGQAPASPVSPPSPPSSASWGGVPDASVASHSDNSSAGSPGAASAGTASAGTGSAGTGAPGESVPGFSGWSGDAGPPRPAPDTAASVAAGDTAGAGDSFAGVPDQPADAAAEEPAAEGVSSYVPAPVSFVSPDEAEPGSDGLQDGLSSLSGFGSGSGSPGWKDSGRGGDSGAGRRRPVVFEEDDDLDVPDFLK